jgi:hypothetical protein
MSTDTTILFILSNVSTACIVGTISLAAVEIWKRQKAADFAEAAENRTEAAKTWLAVTESREHFFAFAAQPQQQHAALSSAELPVLSAESHEDEQAPAEDDDHTGWWRVAAALVWGLAEYVREETPLEWLRLLWRAWQDRRAAKDRLDGEETPLTEESPHRMGPIEEAEVRRLVESHGESDAEAFEIEVAEIVAAEDRKRKVRYLGRHWAHDTQHTGQFPIVPAQRDGEVAA